MAEQTVEQLAESVKVPVDRLLSQMKDAGLNHKQATDSVNEEEKQALLSHLQASHGETKAAGSKITLKRRSNQNLKAGQGRTGRTVNVEVRRKRTLVRREAVEEAPEAPAAEPAAATSQAELEAKRIRDEELARKAAEEAARTEEEERKAEAARKAEEERVAAEEAARKAEEERKAAEATSKPAADAQPVSAADVQAKEQSEQRGGKRGKAKDKERDRKFEDGPGRRRSLGRCEASRLQLQNSLPTARPRPASSRSPTTTISAVSPS